MVTEIRSETALLMDRRLVRWLLLAWTIVATLVSLNAAWISVPVVEAPFWRDAVISTTATLGSLIGFAAGAVIQGSMFRDRSIQWRAALCVHRWHIVAAKATAGALVGSVIATVGLGCGVLAFCLGRHTSNPFEGVGVATAWSLCLGALIAVEAFTLMGIGVSAALRSDTWAVSVAMAWIVVVEGQVLQGSHRALLPYASATGLTAAFPSASRWSFILTLSCWAVGSILLGGRRTVQIDV